MEGDCLRSSDGCRTNCLLCGLMKRSIKSTSSIHTFLVGFLFSYTNSRHSVRRCTGDEGSIVSRWPSHTGVTKKWAWFYFRKSEVDRGSRCRPVFKTFPRHAKTCLLKRFLGACCDGGGVCWSETLPAVDTQLPRWMGSRKKPQKTLETSLQSRIHTPDISGPEGQDQ